ncbi:MAG: FAD:protein FMN transferase [Oscillospiraceae bacterium]|nr:FAD:protein FMN transferase [Oscillospiraceae bacterium]
MKKLLCVFFALLFLAGCAPKTPKAQRDIFAMDTLMSLQLWGEDADAAAEDVEAMLHHLEARWSVTREDSITAGLNRGIRPEMTPQELALLSEVEALYRRTGGAFNPYLGEVSRLWGFYDKNYRVPDAQECFLAIQAGMLDMGAALKGYAGDRAVEILEELDVERAILNLGGNIQTYGHKPGGEPWKIGIADPIRGGTLGVVAVEGTMSIVTSGSYQRYFEQDGVRYHHIMDGATGAPADSGLVSVTVISRSGLTADALSTALFVMGLEEAAAFWRQSEDFEAVFVLADGTVYATAGANLSGCAYQEISS